MREDADDARIRGFMRALGAATKREGMCYFTGGATAVLMGWRASTIDVDIELVPEQDDLLRALPLIKEELQINVELASPGHFIPLPTGWAERSLPAGQAGLMAFRHFDPYSQALAKIERGHAQDVEDVAVMLERGLVEPDRLHACFQEIEPQLYRFPAIEPSDFRHALEAALP